MSKLWCAYCEKDGKPKGECWIVVPHGTNPDALPFIFDKHLKDRHTPEIVEQAYLAISKPGQKVLSILVHDKAAQSNPGLVIVDYYRRWPFRKKYQVIYNASDGSVDFPHFANLDDAIDFARNIGSIGRVDRAVRRKHPELNGSVRKRVARDIQEMFSKHYWAGQNSSEEGS